MSDKNKKINKAASLGWMIEFWNFVYKYADKIMRFAADKVIDNTFRQNDVLNEITVSEKNKDFERT